MLGVEWTTEVGDSFTESEQGSSEKEPPSESNMFHGTIDLIGSSDEEYESDLLKPEEETTAERRVPQLAAAINDVIDNSDVTDNSDAAENFDIAENRDLTENCDVTVPQVDEVVDEDVMDVVNDIVGFVERNVTFPEFGYDPDGMVKPEEIELREGSCMKPYCQLGCLCSSLRGAFQHVPTHCSKEGCMFECHCQARGLSAIDDETHYADKSKRKKKIPNRFKDVVLGRAYKKLHARTIHDSSDDSDSDSDYESSLPPTCKKTSPVSSPAKAPSPEPKKDANGLVQSKPDNSWINSDKIANIKKTIAERRVGFVANTIAEDQTLADINIWCSQHNKYSCLCINYVYFSKTNQLLWKPSNKSRYLANKVMFDILLKEPSHKEVPYEVFPYNRSNHCARTHGTFLDYKIRNRDEVFMSKRKLELEHNVLSYSNSYVKFRNFLLVKASEPVPSAEPYNKSGKKRSMGKMIHIVKTAERCRLDVGEENMDVNVNYQLDDGNSEDEEEPKTKVSGRKRKLTQKMKELEEEKKREREAEMEDMKRIQEEMRLRQAMEEVPAKVPRKRGRPPKPKPGLPGAELPAVDKPLETIRRPSDDERSALKMVRRPSDGEKSAVKMVRRSSDVEKSASKMVRRSSDGERPALREPRPEVHIIPFKKNGLKCALRERKKEEEVRIKQEPTSLDYFSAESRMDMEVENKDDLYAPAVSQEPSLNLDIDRTSATVEVSATSLPKTQPVKDSSKALKDCLEKEFREDTPKPFLGFSDCDDNSESDSDFVDSIHSKKVLVLGPRSDGYPHLGLMCLTPGVGYLSVTESLRGRVVIVDPISPAEQHTFNTLQIANDWLNRFFRSKVVFSSPDLMLQWILVTPGVLKLKQSRPVNPDIFQDPNMVITSNGPVRFQPSYRKSLTVANNCSLLRKQLSEHSVFSPLIKKQLAMREHVGALHNPKFSVDGSRWVPNPKFGMKRQVPLQPVTEERFQSSDNLVSLQHIQNVSFDTSDGCVTVQRVPACQPSQDTCRSPPAATRPPQLTPIDVAMRPAHQFSPIDQSMRPAHQFSPIDQSMRPAQQFSPIDQSMRPAQHFSPIDQSMRPAQQFSPIDQSMRPAQQFSPIHPPVSVHPQATLRPLPNLTKILSNKLTAKLSTEKKD